MNVKIRKAAPHHRITVVRDDGVTLELRPPDKKFSPPHDVVHLVVEKALGFEKAFWATVAQGAIFPNMTVRDGRQRAHADTRSKALIKSNRRFLNESEVYVGVFQEVLRRDPKAYENEIGLLLRERGCDIGPDKIAEIYSSLRVLRKRWNDLAVGESISLDWTIRTRGYISNPRR